MTNRLLHSASLVSLALAWGCSSGSSATPNDPGASGDGGAPSSAGAVGAAGAGTSGTSSSAGAGGSGTTGGSATAGTSGAASTAGASGSGTSGSAGAGAAGTGGSSGTAGSSGSSGSSGTAGSGGTPATCGGQAAPNPFGCSFAWGLNQPSGAPSSYGYLQFISNWAGYNIKADATFSSFDAGGWLKQMGSASAVPAYYAYLIGYYGHVNGLPDGNQQPNGPNLTTGMGALLLGTANAACPQGVICADNLIVKAYAYYATQTYAAYKKPIIWLLEGDFIQYSPEGKQTKPLSYAQLGQLAAQITLAIKCNDPPAVVAFNYSTWISSAQLSSYFGGINDAMAAAGTTYDMVWTSGKGNSASPGNATYAALHTLTGKPILVDESFGLSVADDTWANQSAATIDSRISDGVVAANVTAGIPSYLQGNVTGTLAPSALSSTCK